MGDWSGWAQANGRGRWHQVDHVRGSGLLATAWFPCLARRAHVDEVLDYRATPPGEPCRHRSCRNPGDEAIGNARSSADGES